MKPLRVLSCVLILQSLSFQLSYAWKPIAAGSSFSTSFSLKQSHPDIGAKSFVVSAPVESVDETSSLLHQEDASIEAFKNVGLSLSGAHLGAEEAAQSFSFGEEQQFGYNFGETRDISGSVFREDRCAVKKYAFNHDGVVKYNNEIPELNQFTICFWMRFTNHSGDHVILTYSAEEQPREVQFWVANAKNASFFSMAIKGQQMYRLNYPLRVRQWHHTCSSWNGKTGEWQVWLKAERIGRGFHNSLVGHKIPANGKLFSGGPSVTGAVSEGLHFEVTLVQLYRIALSAGKAHRDHKHHHVHHFDHEGQELVITTKAPPKINRPQPMNNLLASGQIPTRVRINLAQQPAVPAQVAGNQPPLQGVIPEDKLLGSAVTINTNFVNGQINTGSRLVTQQLIGLPAGPHPQQQQLHAQTTSTSTTHEFNSLSNPANTQFIDETETRIFFKRHAKINATKSDPTKTKTIRKRRDSGDDKVLKKRGLVLLNDGSVVDDSLVTIDNKYEGLAEFGGQQFKHDLTAKMNIEDEITQHDREPAEEEVRAVMSLCGNCDVEPFQGAIVLAWKDVSEQLDNALKGYSVGRCENF